MRERHINPVEPSETFQLPMQFGIDGQVRTDPEPCLHQSIGVCTTEEHDYATMELVCCSCHTAPPPEHWEGRRYEYDPANVCWVLWVGPSPRR